MKLCTRYTLVRRRDVFIGP